MKIRSLFEQQLATFVEVCHDLDRKGFVTGHGGNCAWRVTDEHTLITPTQRNKGSLQPEDVVIIDSEGMAVDSDLRPTGELPMYMAFFEARPDVRSVVHSHPPMSGAFAISNGKNWLARPLYPETVTEVGPAVVVEYAEPLTTRLADSFRPHLPRYNAFLMANHGVVILTPGDITWCMMLTDLLEATATSVVAALSVGGIRELAPGDVAALDNILRTRNLPLHGAPGQVSSLVEAYYPDSTHPRVEV